MDDLNLYDDLDEFQEQQEKKSKELQDVEDKYGKALETIQGLKEDNKGLQKKIQRIELSFQSLLDTARMEIKRKDKEIDRLRKEKDDICFRRKFPNRHQGAPDTDTPFQQLAKNSSATTKTYVSQLQELEQDLSKVHKPDSGCLGRERSSDRFGESHKRRRSRDDRDSYYHKRQRNDKERQMSIDSHRDNRREDRKGDRERDYPYKNERHQRSDYPNLEHQRNRHGHHKTHRESSKSPVHGEYRNSGSEQYHNTKYSPSRRPTHTDNVYCKYTKSSERKERSHRIQPAREENGNVTKNISKSNSPERKSSKTLNTVSLEPSRQAKEQHSSHAAKQRNEEQLHSNVCKDVGPQHESDFDRKEDKSKPTSSQKTPHTSEKTTNQVSLKNIACTQEVAVKDTPSLGTQVTESVPNIVPTEQIIDISGILGSNENMLSTSVTKGSQESQNSQITKNRNALNKDCLYEYLDEETSTQSHVSVVEALLYEDLDCEPCTKDLKQTDDPPELSTKSQQVESTVDNMDYAIVSKTNKIQNVVYEIPDDELSESSLYNTKNVWSIRNAAKQKINNVDMSSATCHKSKEVVSEIVDNGLPLDAARNDDLQKSTNDTGEADSCGIPVSELNKFLNPSKVCTPRTVALLDSLFGPSPSSASSADSNKNLLTHNNGIDNDSTTTPADYSDCATVSTDDVDKTQNNFDMAAFENCFAENTKVTDKTLTQISLEDSSVDCVMVGTPSRVDVDGDCLNSCQQTHNTILTDILNKSSTTTSPGDSSSDCLIVVTPSRETGVGLQQSYDKTELDNCFVKNADTLDHVEEDKLKTNLTKTSSEDSSSKCLMNHTESSKDRDDPLLNNNNNIDSAECFTPENCSREQVLSHCDTIDMAEKYVGEEVKRSEAPAPVNARNVTPSKGKMDFEANDQLTSLNNDVECYTSVIKYSEISIPNSGTQQKQASEETKEDNFNGKSDHSSKKNTQTQKQQQGKIITVVNKSDEGQSDIKCNAKSSITTGLLKNSPETITWDLTSPTSGTISQENKEEFIGETSIIKSIETGSTPTDTDTTKYPNNIVSECKILTDKCMSVVQTVPDILNEAVVESENNLYALSSSSLGRGTLHTKESISVANDETSKPSVGIADLYKSSSNEVFEVREVCVRDSDTLKVTVSKETKDKCKSNLPSTIILNLDLTISQINEMMPMEDISATTDLIPSTDLKIKTQNVLLETTSTKDIISKKSHSALLLGETNYKIKEDVSPGKFNVSDLSSPDRNLTVEEGTIEDKHLSVVSKYQLSTAGVNTVTKQSTLSVKHKEGCARDLIDSDNSKGTPSADLKSIDLQSVFTGNEKTQTQVVLRDMEICTTDSSHSPQPLYPELGDAHKQQLTTPTITLDQYSTTKESGAKPANICGDSGYNANSIETIPEKEVSTRSTVSNSTNELESNDLSSQSSPKENISSSTEISFTTTELYGCGTILKPHDLEKSLSALATFAGTGLKKEMTSITSEELIPKTVANDAADANDLKNKEDVAVQSDVIFDESNNLENPLKLRYINKKCCETTVNIPDVNLISSENVENQTPLSTVLVEPSLLKPGFSLALAEKSFPENTKENIGKADYYSVCQSKENAETTDLCMETDQTPNISASKDIPQKDCSILWKTTVNIPGLDLLLSSENLEDNLDTSSKSPSHKTTMFDNPKGIKECIETDRVPISNAGVMNSNKSKKLTDDTDVTPSENAKAEVYPNVDTVLIPGLDLLYPDVQQEFATLNETGVSSTITTEKAKHVDARHTSSIPIPAEVRTDISDPNINNPETKASHKLPPSFDNVVVNEVNIEQETDVNCCKENSEDPIKYDAVTGDTNISIKNLKENSHSNREKYNVVNNNENSTIESKTTQTKNASKEKVVLKSQLETSYEKTENITISEDNPRRTKQEIKPEIKENAVSGSRCTVVDVEVIDDLELRCNKDHRNGLGTNNVFLPVDLPFVVDEDTGAKTSNDGNVLNMSAQKCVSTNKVTEEINNNPESDEFKKDTKIVRDLQNNCKQLEVAEFGQNFGSQIIMTGEKLPPPEDVIEKCIKSPPLFNKPAEKTASPNSKLVSRELFDGMNVYSQQAASKISAAGKEMSEKSSSSNFDAIVNFERNLSLVDKPTEHFAKDIETLFITAEKKKESINNCDCESRDKGELGKLCELHQKHESIMKFKTNDRQEPETEKFGKEQKNANNPGNLSGCHNLPILCHKVSRILYNSSRMHIEKTNTTPDLSGEEQGIRSMIFKNPIQTQEQNTEAAIIKPPLLQTVSSKELQNTKMINSPTCNHISLNLNFYRDQSQDLTVKNVDIAETPNICVNPLCVTPRSSMRNICNTINSSLNTLKTSTVSDSYGLPNNLPSISTKCPTPPNFSGIFSKITFIDSACEDTEKYTKKSPKVKACIIPAASVLCNVDNLQNATKASKKLHWEILENNIEMTEIEDDSDVNSTDEERQLDKKECADDKMTHNELKKLPTNDSILLAPYKNLKSIKKSGIASEFSKMSANVTPNLLKDLKCKKSRIPRRNSIDIVPPLTDETLEQFKQLTITKLSTNESVSPYKVIKSHSQASKISNKLKSNLMHAKVKCPQSLMASELLQAAVIKSTKSISINMSANAISKPVLNLATDCKMSKKNNAKVQQLIPIQKKKRGRPPKQKIAEQNIDDRAVSEGKECMSEKTDDIVTTNNSKEKRSDRKQKEPDKNCKISEENVTQNASMREKQNYTIKKGPQYTGLHEECQNKEVLAHKLVAIEPNAKSASVNKNATNMNDTSACGQSPVKADVHKNSLIYEKLHSSDEQNSSVAENSEPECNKYLKEDGLHPTSKETIEPAHTQNLVFKSADKSALKNYKIPKHKKQEEGTCSSDNKLISMEDISIKERSIKVTVSTFQIPKTVGTTNELNKMSCGMETYISSEECEKTKKQVIEVQKQKLRNLETSKDTFKGERGKSPETLQRRQNKKEKNTHSNEDTHCSHISNSRSKESFVDLVEEVSTLASKKFAQTDKISAMHLNNDTLHVYDQSKNKVAKLKPRRKSMYSERTTENSYNLCDQDNTSRQVRPLRKSLSTERHFDETVPDIPQTADRNVNNDSRESKQHTGRRKSVNTQRRILDTSSEGDEYSSRNSPKTPTGNSKKDGNRISTPIIPDIVNTDRIVYNKIDLYNQYVQARNECLRLHEQLMGDTGYENDSKTAFNAIEELQTNDQHFCGTHRASTNSNERNKNIKSDAIKQRRKTIHSLDADNKSTNGTRETRKTMFDGTKSSNTFADYRPGMKLKESSSDIKREHVRKVGKIPSNISAATGNKEKPLKTIAMRRKSMYTEINSFDSTTDHSLDHLNLQKSKDLHINSDTNSLTLGRYQDGNSRKSTRNRRKSMYIERMPLISSDDTDTAPEILGNTRNKVSNNETCQEIHNPVETKTLLDIEDKESLKLSNTKETNIDYTKRENNIDTVCTEKICKTYGSTNLNNKEIQEVTRSDIQGAAINPINSLRLLNKLNPSDKGAPRSVEGDCKNVLRKEKYVNEDTRNSIQVGAEEDDNTVSVSGNKLELNKTINDSIPIKTFSKHQQIDTPEKHPDKPDNASGSDTPIMAQNIKNNKIRLKPINLQRRILDSSSSDVEEEDKIVNPEKTVIHNENKQPAAIIAVKEKCSSRKRRIVKVVSTSLTNAQIAKKVNCISDQSEVTTPASSPTLSHPIFNTQVPDKSQSLLNLTPLSNDDCFQKIDSTLRDMFQSPQHETERSNLQAAQASVISVLATEALLNGSGANITIDETIITNREIDESCLNISGSYDSKSLNSSASQDQSATKHLSLGTSNYRFEKVSENVVNLFISRKRKRNKRTNNINES